MTLQDAEILIIGGGVFGLSTALTLASTTYKDSPGSILVVDRAKDCPSPDAASSDLNKIVREDYADPVYSDLALEASKHWLNDPLYKPFFHESGLLVSASESSGHGAEYVEKSLNNCSRLHAHGKAIHAPIPLRDANAYAQALNTPQAETGPVPPHAYLNPLSGWAWSGGAVKAVAAQCRTAGVRFADAQINGLIVEDGDVRGVVAADGRRFRSTKLTMLATGSWTAAIVPEFASLLVATGQVLATIQLTDDERGTYSKMPVIIDIQTGYYMFPPNESGILKIATHLRGFTNMQPSLSDPDQRVSIPRTAHFGGNATEEIPAASQRELRQHLERYYPDLASRPFAMTRICWYCDTPDTHFAIGYHPHYPSLFIAAGDSGHAFKFLPITGNLCLEAIERRLPQHLADTWSLTRKREDHKPDRGTSKLQDLQAAYALR